MKKRILGIDLGDVRTGIAVSDAMQMLAGGVGTITAYNDDRLINEIAVHVKYYDPELIVIGYPINMDGSIGPRAEKIAAFSKKLEERFSLPVKYVDERCTTMIAHSILNTTNTRGKKRKQVVDTLSAEIILQSYLDSK
jgi:putative Holliday junction resolvase